MSSENFYQHLAPFGTFSEVVNSRNFEEVPSDWVIFVTDVMGSTRAIEEGRYRDVNTIGAATIAAAQNVLGSLRFPYVFGGDGAALIVPTAHAERVSVELAAVQRLAHKTFDLDLRIGRIGVDEVEKRGARILIAKLELKPGKSIAMFRGGGLLKAEELIKGSTKFAIPTSSATDEADLTGLSCRWNPIPSRQGQIVSLLVQGRGTHPEYAYSRVLQSLTKIFHSKLDEANPVHQSGLRYRGFWNLVREEFKFHEQKWGSGFWKRLYGSLISVLLFKCGLRPPDVNVDHYVAGMDRHSDYLKFDDTLRMVLDCTPEQIRDLKTYLETSYQAGEIFYGLFESTEALMTCYVNSMQDGEHIHFIDGSHGGYAMAAKQLKAQIAANGSDQKKNDRMM
ncbi:MAG TPA: DUF3095 family protein [Bdellovibrionota bacterium]|nr:DUF3095 family protein [Bdellovibrionota bacterium]